MENLIKINVVIDGVKHEMNVEPSKEPLYRRAAELVNKELLSLKSAWDIGSKGDYITYVAFIFAMDILTRNSNEENSDVNGKLNDILKKLKTAAKEQ